MVLNKVFKRDIVFQVFSMILYLWLFRYEFGLNFVRMQEYYVFDVFVIFFVNLLMYYYIGKYKIVLFKFMLLYLLLNIMRLYNFDC